MPYQRKPGYCGPAALQTALQVHGKRLGQDRLAKLCGTDEDGTDEHGLISAITELGFGFEELCIRDKNEARSALLRFAPVAPIILCVDDYDHWVVVAGQCGRRLWLFDSTREPWNAHNLGRQCLLPKTITRRWKASKRATEDGASYYGLAILS
jgi:ABC-type bacteriocin/lantibiotic exporter with double-glycine peptidase domain